MSSLLNTISVTTISSCVYHQAVTETQPSHLRVLTDVEKATIDYDGDQAEAWFGLFDQTGGLIAVCDNLPTLVSLLRQSGYKPYVGALA